MNSQTATPSHTMHLVPRPARSAAFEAGQGRAQRAAQEHVVLKALELQAAAERGRTDQLHDRQQAEKRGYNVGEQRGYVDGQTHGLLQGLIVGIMLSGVAMLVYQWFTRQP